MFTFRRRSPLSIIALRTHKVLVWAMGLGAVSLFASYLFLMNHLSMQGYLLTKEMEEHALLSRNLDQLEAELAQTESREYIQKAPAGKSLMAQGHAKTYVIIPSSLTARK